LEGGISLQCDIGLTVPYFLGKALLNRFIQFLWLKEYMAWSWVAFYGFLQLFLPNVFLECLLSVLLCGAL
jgi:hypothetical protein